MLNPDSIPQPHATIACQDLISKDSSYHAGVIRKRPGLSGWMATHAAKVTKVFSWPHRMVIATEGCIYIYKRETDKKPTSAFSLYGYNRVETEKEPKEKGSYQWVIKIVPVQQKQYTYYFACAFEDEMKKWMAYIRKQLYIGNCMPEDNSGEDAMSISNLSQLEEAIYDETSSMTEKINRTMPDPNLSDQSDPDSDDEYKEIDPNQMDPLAGLKSSPTIRSKPLPTPPDTGPRNGVPLHDRPVPQIPPSFSSREPPALPTQNIPKRKDKTLDRPPPPIPDGEDNDRSSMPAAGSLQDKISQFNSKPMIAKKPGNLPGAVAMPMMAVHGSPLSPKSPTGGMKLPPRRDRPDIGGFPSEPPPPPVGKKKVPPVPNDRTSMRHGSSSQPAYSSENHDEPKVIDDEPIYEDADPENVLEADDFFSKANFEDGDKTASSEMIKKIGVDGAFLVRPGGTGTEKVLVVYAEREARKYKINEEQDEYYINADCRFDNINELLVHYMSHSLPKRSARLAKPYREYIGL